MNKKIGIGLLGLVLAGVLVISAKGTPGQEPKKVGPEKPTLASLWKQVDTALSQGLPQSAEKILRQIHATALEQKNWGEALHALSSRISCQGTVAGNKPAEKIKILKTEMETAPVEMRPLMQLMLTQWYWQYYSRERWRFLNRSATAQLDDDDFTTWDLRKLFGEISGIFQNVLKEKDKLKSLPIASYTAALDTGNMPPEWRSTLFDFAAWTALEFYTSAEQAGAKAENAFEISADSPALGPLTEFLAWQPQTQEQDSPQLLAITLYQDLLRFQQRRGHSEALADADLLRLRYLRNVAIGEEAAQRYIERLKNWVKELGKSTLASQACFLWAQEKLNGGDAVLAMDLCKQGLSLSATGRGAINCAALKAQILQKEYEVESPAVQLPQKPLSFKIQYKNIDHLYARVVSEALSTILRGENPLNQYNYPNEARQKAMLSAKVVAEWQIKLDKTADFQLHSQTVSGPALPAGLYRVIVSHSPDFKPQGNKLSSSSLQVSGLAMISRERWIADSQSSSGENRFEGFVSDGQSGMPLTGSKLTLYNYDYNARRYKMLSQSRSLAEGYFSFGTNNNDYYRLLVVEDARLGRLLQAVDSNRADRDPRFRQDRSVFFTDRAIYRPGQTIHFKGIMLRPNERGEAHAPKTQWPVQVELRDVNDQEVAELDLVSNDFGSFSGSFTAPADRLTGQMSLKSNWSNDRIYFRVEEYKRPKFEVKVKLPEREFRLGQEVKVEGQALSYTGAPIDGSQVSYRVTRMVQYPRWWSWYYPVSAQAQEITHGRVKTDQAGQFEIKFMAKPDLKVKADTQPIFTYQISADVTDASGETRSDQCSLRLGYAALAAELNAPDWLEAGKALPLTVRLTTHNGQALAGKGVVEIHALQGPDKPVAQELTSSNYGHRFQMLPATTLEQGADWQRWPLGKKITQKEFSITKAGEPCQVSFELPVGVYRARLNTQDAHGTAVEALAYLLVYDNKALQFSVPIPFHAAAQETTVEVGKTFTAMMGTGYAKGSVLVEILRDNQWVRHYWTAAAQTQTRLQFPVTADLRGGFMVQLSFIQDQRLYQKQIRVDVPWSNKELKLQWQSFRSKLLPGQKETWALQIKGPGAEKRAAELVATLYDESLDQFLPHSFASLFGLFRQESGFLPSQFSNQAQGFLAFQNSLNTYISFFGERYLRFPDFIAQDFFGYAMDSRRRSKGESEFKKQALDSVDGAVSGAVESLKEEIQLSAGVAAASPAPIAPPSQEANSPQEKANAVGGGKASTPKLDAVQARKNLSETAFFFPQLRSNADGSVKLEFTMPEALTRWHFLALAHTKSLEYGMIQDHAVTQKDLMVQPNPPRFLREGDELEFSVKVSNQSEKAITGKVRLSFFDPQSDKSLDAELANQTTEKEFTIPAKQSKGLAWKIRVPDGLSLLGYRAVAASEKLSDGEEGQFLVLSRRIAVQEALPLWISKAGEKTFTFDKLQKSAQSNTLRHLGLTVQMTSNPAWYAVQALPYLMEYPWECAEQTFNRLYGNALAEHIADSDPKIRRVFDGWKGTDALKSNLEKNQDLKSALLQESPWVIDAQKETAAKQRVGLLFDQNHMKQEIGRAFEKLKSMQYDDGAWPWFPGGPRSEYITLYIFNGFGRLQHLGVKGLDMEPARKACHYLDNWISEIHRLIVRDKREQHNNLSSTIALYLYARSFFVTDQPLSGSAAKAVVYFQDQARKFWLQLDFRMSQAQLALALQRLGDTQTAQKIMRSMKERSQVSEELGRFWGELELSWWWFRAPIETQAMMIEAFAEVMNDQAAVEECKVWLLKQKQTQDWKTTKATADAVYGLLLRGEKLLASDKLVEVSLGGQLVRPEKVEIGTGFYEKRYSPPEIKPEMGQIVVKKSDPGIAWGGVHWSYLEDIAKITPHAGTPLNLKKRLFVQRETAKGKVIEPVKGPLEVGDLLVVRIELRSDRDMEYLHLKDHRGSGLEPVNVLSQYKFQDGLAYYESTRDTASHFFIDYLPKGTYVFEYSLRVVHKGRYQTGLASIGCMYAPEFNSHSESIALEVR